MKSYFLLLIISCPLLSIAQTHVEIPSGIKFDQTSSWQQIKRRAKLEHKYIFLDCYTTWCAPCKLMEKEVYPKDEVGAFFNQNFISVKVQIDRTNHDSPQIQTWYDDVKSLGKKYGIPGYPTFLFFSPDGKLRNRALGYKAAGDFIYVGQKAITPTGTQAYQQYYMIVEDYDNGKKDYFTMAATIDTARMLGQNERVKAMSLDYKNYLMTGPESTVYIKSNIAFLATQIQGSKDFFFKIFYPDGTRADEIMGIQGFSAYTVDKIIQQGDLAAVFAQQVEAGPTPASLPSEPDWQKYFKAVNIKYSSEYADRNILKAKIKYFGDNHQWSQCARYINILVRKYSLDGNDGDADAGLMFAIWWSIFDRSVDKDQIDAAINCMKAMMIRVTNRNDAPFCFLDTYACLLYKAGRKKEAIELEEQALQTSINWKQPESDIEEYKTKLEKMKGGFPISPRYIDKDDIFTNGLI